MKIRDGWRPLALALLAAAALPAGAQGASTTALDDRWHFSLAPYLWATALEGDLSAGNLVTVPVDASFSDVVGNLDIGLQGHFEARKNRLGLAADFMWTNLGAPVDSPGPLAAFEADVRQLVSEGYLFYRVAQGGRADNPAHLNLLVGLRYTGTRSRLTAESATAVSYAGDSTKLSWVDAMVGAKFKAPLGRRVAFLGRADVAGFGSKVTWNLEGDLAWRAAERFTLGAGWRHMDIDYEEGEGRDLRKVDLVYQGPRLWFAYSW